MLLTMSSGSGAHHCIGSADEILIRTNIQCHFQMMEIKDDCDRLPLVIA